MAKCPGCGSSAVFDIELQKLKCPNCDNVYDPETTENVQTAKESDMMGMTVYTCPNCGGELYSIDSDLTGTCSYCGADVVFESRLEQGERPLTILPFKITKDNCKEIFLNAVKKNYFAPNDLKDPDFIEGFRGIYMPYWMTRIRHKGTGTLYGERTLTHGDLVTEETWKFNFPIEAFYSDFVHDASSSFSDDISERVEPYILHGEDGEACKRFYPAYLSGFYAEMADMPESVYDPSFRKEANERTDAFIKNNNAFEGFSVSDRDENGEVVPPQYTERTENTILSLFPVWFLSYRKGERVAYMTINGQTGRMTADLPISMGQFFKVAALLFVVFAAALYSFTLRPLSVATLAVWFSFIVLAMNLNELMIVAEHSEKIIVHTERKTLSTKTFNIGGWGLFGILLIAFCLRAIAEGSHTMAILTEHTGMSCYAALGLGLVIMTFVKCMKIWTNLEKENRVPPYFGMAALCAAMGTFTVWINPFADSVYYIVCSLMLIALTVSVFGMINNFNFTVTQPLPQFEHKGGNDHA